MKRQLTYIQGAFILTMTNLITGVLAFVYRIFLSRSIGAEGVGVYQLVLPLYSLFITLVSGGITTAVSKLIAEQSAVHNTRNMYKTVRICCILIGAWSFAICALVAFNANFLAQYMLKDMRTLYSIIVFTPAVLFIAIGAVLKGYFFGLQDVNPPAFIDIVEKVIRLVGLCVTTYLLLPYGIAYICAGAMIAMASGELISLLLLFALYKNRKMRVPANTGKTEPTAVIMGKILKIALPLSISGALVTIMEMISAVLVPQLLRNAGFSHKSALSLYGELTGMVTPLLFFPFIIVASLCVTLVPAITSSYTARNWIPLNKKCNDSLKITSVIGFGATALFLIFPSELCRIFFNRPEAGPLLFWMAIACIFEYWQFALFAIMNGIGMQIKVLQNSILNIVITIVCAYVLIPITSIGIYGYVIGFMASAVIVTFANLKSLKTVRQIRIDYFSTLVKPFICFIGMFAVTLFCNFSLTSSGINKFNFLASSGIGLATFAFLVMITGTFTLKQLKSTIGGK